MMREGGKAEFVEVPAPDWKAPCLVSHARQADAIGEGQLASWAQREPQHTASFVYAWQQPLWV